MSEEILNYKDVIQAIYRANGIIAVVARSLGVSEKTIYRYRDKNITVKNAIDDARHIFNEKLLDEAELKLLEAVRDGKPWAIKYVLDRKGILRGYLDQSKVENVGSQEVCIKVEYSD